MITVMASAALPTRRTEGMMQNPVEPINLVWLALCAGLVMLMQAGFCCLESGFARSKNSINVAIKNLFDFCISSVVFWLFGFGLMFGASWHGLIGDSLFAVGRDAAPGLLAFLLFQLAFCGTATTIISGAVAERIRFRGYLLISCLVSAVFYPIYGHWAWGGTLEGAPAGWLSHRGFIDFAGSTVVHSLGGWISLAAILVIGPRIGRFDRSKPPMRASNVPLATLGVFLLWFGWFGFNGGSTFAVTNQVPLILLNTNLAAAAGGVGALALSWLFLRRPDVALVINGVLAGLVGITASCHLMEPWAAIVIGAVAGVISVLATWLLDRIEIDDVVGAVPVHGCGGVWGTLAIPLFMPTVTLTPGVTRLQQLVIQCEGVTACFFWAFCGAYLVLRILNYLQPLRANAQAELLGLNIAEHEAGSDLFDLLNEMEQQRSTGDFSHHVTVEPHTEVGEIADEYNRVLDRVDAEIRSRQDAVEELRRAQEKYRSIFENAIEGIFQTTPTGQYLSANPALARIYGYATPEELFHGISDIKHQLYVDTNRRSDFTALLHQQGSVIGFESEVYRRDGSVIWISENARVIRDDLGKVLYYEGSVEDITEHKQSESLRAEKESAIAASRAKSEFLANMSHEIRTPLNGVIGMLDLLSGTPLSTQQQRFARIAKSSADSLLSLINQILDFSKIEAGKVELELIDFDLQLAVEDAVELFIKRAQDKQIELICQIHPNVPTNLRGDPERLRQILINLINNAVKFTESGQVVVRVGKVDDQAEFASLRFSVSDTGIGIPADRMNRLFQSFSQVDTSTTRRFGGTGLGLAISKQLVEIMGGAIAVESEIGQGSTFFFTIPLVKQLQPHTAAHVPDHLRQMRFLGVDDNATNLEILSEQFNRWGLNLTTVDNAHAALALLEQSTRVGPPFDATILDVQMPVMDGYELAAEFKRRPELRDMKLLLLSSMGDEPSEQELRVQGLSAYLHKPVRQSRLLEALILALGDHTTDSTHSTTYPLSPETEPQRRGKLLVAEDNEINQIVVSEILKQSGFDFELVENGAAAVRRATQDVFSAILMDCQMPEMDGFEATRVIRQHEQNVASPRRIPIIALTANAVKGDRERCLDSGMDEYLTKPVDPFALINKLEALLARELGSARDAAASPCAAITGTSVIAKIKVAPVPISEINVDELMTRCLGNSEIVEQVLGKFAQRSADELSRLEQAHQSQQFMVAEKIAHLLKGMAANMAATHMLSAAGELERALKSHDRGSTQNHLAALCTATERVIAEIPRVLANLRSNSKSTF